ncbi:P-loop containing nucleoside triphosphate hydrolase protein [Ilyonectria destructans]|nr:P-loop containing nucleoside triphosphate hydrolase protein [Ilyonectria destructans]
MAPSSISPEQKAAVREYVIKNKRIAIKISVLGASGSGRRSILQRLTLGMVLESYDPTENGEHRMMIHIEKHPVMLEFSMQLGSEIAARNAWHQQLVQHGEAFLLVYDVTDRASFELLRTIHSGLFGPKEEEKPVWVLATKTDQPQQNWAVSMQEGAEFSTTINAKFLTVSAQTGEGLGKDDAVELASEVIISKALKLANAEATGAVRDLNSGQSRSRFSLHGLRDKVKELLHKETK